MMDFANIKLRGDKVIWMIFLFLCLISIVEVYSASSMLTFRTNYWLPILKHTASLLIGGIIIYYVHRMNPKHFWIFAAILPVVWCLLLITQIMGHTINGANRFLFGFQPSEVAKLSLIACVAYFLSLPKETLSESLSFKWIWALTIVTCVLILKNNFSTGALLYGVVAIMMFIGQISFKRMSVFSLVTLVATALLFAFILAFPQKSKELGISRGHMWNDRIKNYNEQPDVRKGNYIVNDDNFQTTQAKIAVAQGGIIGKMPGNGNQRDFLPQAYSDFIYAIIIEEMGIIGGIVVLALYVFLFIRAGTIARRCEDLFSKYLVMGCATMISLQALVNMAVSVGLIPVTGQPLPLVSRGGSSILITCIYVGIILNVSRFENSIAVEQDVEMEEDFEGENLLDDDEDDAWDVQPAY